MGTKIGLAPGFENSTTWVSLLGAIEAAFGNFFNVLAGNHPFPGAAQIGDDQVAQLIKQDGVAVQMVRAGRRALAEATDGRQAAVRLGTRTLLTADDNAAAMSDQFSNAVHKH